MLPPIPADGGVVTFKRRTANFVYGSWRVTAPDGIEQIVPDEQRNDGYVYRPPDAPQGRFDLAFVRQDATIELDEITQAGETSGRSDVELQMEAGQQRAEGRTLIERDISGRALGRIVPGVDVSLGDVTPMKIWGKVIDLPITALDWILHGVAVRAGGQLISDAENLRSLNSEVQQQVDAERRRAAAEARQLAEQAAMDRGQTAEIRGIATTASSTATTVKGQATALETSRNDLKAAMLVILDLMQMTWEIRFATWENTLAVKELIAGNVNGAGGAIYYNNLSQTSLNKSGGMGTVISQLQSIISRIQTT